MTMIIMSAFDSLMIVYTTHISPHAELSGKIDVF